MTVSLADLTSVPANLTSIQNEIQSRINTPLGNLMPPRAVVVTVAASTEAGGQHFLRITAAPSASGRVVRVRRSVPNDLSAVLMLGVELGRRSEFRPAPSGSFLRLIDENGSLAVLNTLAGLPQNSLTALSIGPETAVPLTTTPNSIITPTTPTTTRFHRRHHRLRERQ